MSQSDGPAEEFHRQYRRLVHDMRTEFFCIEINAKSLAMYTPTLLRAYALCREQGLDIPEIPAEHLDVLSTAAPEINSLLDELNRKVDEFSVLQTPDTPMDAALQNNQGIVFSGEESCHVLLVEDEEIHQDIASHILAELGCTTDVADNGIEAVQKFREGSYDLVLMDLHMPMMDGMQAAQEIRASGENGKRVPLIGLSNIDPLDPDAYFRAGFNKFLLKPLKVDVFRDTLIELNPHRET
ncbi:response regulator [Granulosicoccaceae sp. 1_MG-2023]|nr:response regulator [Granulosicoccaceae sp. 1_MG-2023]